MTLSAPILDKLSHLDYFVFIFILALTFFMVLWGHRKNSSDSVLDHLLMGRRLTLPLFIATLVATWYGGIFGVAQIAFESGIFNFVTQGLFWYSAYIVFALFLLPKIHTDRYVTLADMVTQLFGEKSGKLSALFNLLNLMPMAYCISIGLIVQMFTGLPLAQGILIGSLFVMSYSLFGGLKSVVYSDLVQFFVMVSSVVFLFLFSLTNFGTQPLLTLPKRYFEPMGGYGFTETFLWGLIAFSTLIDPNFYGRAFAAQSKSVAKKGILISTLIWMIFDLSLTFGAMYAKALLPLAESSDGYFRYALKVLPQGFKGYFLAGVCATVLSTLDSYLFMAGATLSYDLLPQKYRGLKRTHILSFFIITCASILMANLFEGDIKTVWKTLGGLSSSCLLIPVLFGLIYPGKISDRQFFWTSVMSALVFLLYKAFSPLELDALYIGVMCSLILIFSFTKTKFLAQA